MLLHELYMLDAVHKVGTEKEKVLSQQFCFPCRFDDSNNGKIEKNEMKKFIKDIEDLITDSDLKSSGLQRQDSKKKKTLAENAMAEMDFDGDGCITEDEFVKAILEHGKVSKILALKIIDLLLPSPPTTPSITTTAP